MSELKMMIEDKFSSVVNKARIYGMYESVEASKYPMVTDTDAVNETITPMVTKLGSCDAGTGHNNFLKGIVVQFDLSFTVKAWTEAERYHWFDIVSSQSTMHRLCSFDTDNCYYSYVDKVMVDRMNELILKYNETKDKEDYLTCLYSNPCGMILTAGMTTNYLQLKTIYNQRYNHRLPEWRLFCEWLETLPYAKEWICNSKDEKD